MADMKLRSRLTQLGRIANLRLICAGILCLLTSAHAQVTRLDPFIGRDLWKQRLAKREQRSLERMVGRIPKGFMFEPVPWHVWKTTRTVEARLVLLLGESLVMIPGGSSACVQIFDSEEHRIGSWSFQAGWRVRLYDASLEYSSNLASDLIVLHTSPEINGRNIAKEYFALKNDRLRFIRLEDDKGAPIQNEYVFANSEIGVTPDAKTVEQLAMLLESEDKTQVLSALVFLGGKHIDEPERQTFLRIPGDADQRSGLMMIAIPG